MTTLPQTTPFDAREENELRQRLIDTAPPLESGAGNHHVLVADFCRELDSLVAQTTKENPYAQMLQPQEEEEAKDDEEDKNATLLTQYPNHEFAITKSELHVNWPLVNATIRFVRGGRHSVQSALLRKANIAGKIPHFVDSSWDGCYISKKKRAKFSEKQIEHQEAMASYYDLYPSEDDDNGGGVNWNDIVGRSIDFPRTSFQRYAQQMRDELKDTDWREQPASETPLFTDEVESAHLLAKVVSFHSAKGHRVEYWTEQGGDDEAGDFGILQTASGKVMIVLVAGSHPYVFCNLLEYDNSDGSDDLPVLLEASIAKDRAKVLVDNILKTAESFLYSPVH